METQISSKKQTKKETQINKNWNLEPLLPWLSSEFMYSFKYTLEKLLYYLTWHLWKIS